MADNDRMDLKSAPASSQTPKSATSPAGGSGEGFAVGQLILHRYKMLGRAPFDQTAFRAKDLKSDRIVAIRPLVADVVSGGHKLELLAQEVARLRGLQHSNLIQLFDLESGYKPPFVVSELAKGFSLQELLQARSGLAWEEAVQILRPIANVLDFASGEQILNGRISPRRIFIDISNTKEEPAELLQMLIFTWPPFTVRVDPLTFVRLESRPDGRGVSPNAAAISNVRALALLTYELLGGTKSMTSAGGPDLVPLPVLNASANSTLSNGVTNPASFQTSNEFLAAMEKAVAKRNDRGAATGKKDSLREPRKKDSLPEPGKKDSLPDPGKKDSLPEPGKESGARGTLPKAPAWTRYRWPLPSFAKAGVVGLFVAIAVAAGVFADLMLRKTQVPLPIPKPETLFVPKQPITAIVGQISINSTPAGSTFEISDANEQVTRGVTPMTVDNLLVGPYRIRLQHSGWPAHMETVNVQPGKTITVNHTFPTFDVNLRSDPPGATIFKDQFELGQTPLTVSLPPEPIELVSRIEDLEPVRMRVVPDPNHTSTVEFKHQYGTLVISSNRHDAEVSIEESSTGNPPIERVLPPGRYSVVVRAPGFPDQTEVADVQIGQRMVMAFNFATPTPTPPSNAVASSGEQQSSPSTPIVSPASGNLPAASDSSTQSGSGSLAGSPQSENSPQSSGSPSPSIAPSPTTSSLVSSSPSSGKPASPENPPQPSSAPSPVATPATESTLANSSPPPNNSPSADSLPSPNNSASPSTGSHPTIAGATASSSRSNGSPRSTDSTPLVSQPPRSPKHSRPRATPEPTPTPPAFPLGFRTKEEYEKARDDAFRQFNGQWDTQKRELEKSKAYSEYWATHTAGPERDQWVADNQRTQQSLNDFENQRNAAREALKKKWLGQQ